MAPNEGDLASCLREQKSECRSNEAEAMALATLRHRLMGRARGT